MSKGKRSVHSVSARNKKRNNHKRSERNMVENTSKEVTKVSKSAKTTIELNTTDKRQETLEKFQQIRKEMNVNIKD